MNLVCLLGLLPFAGACFVASSDDCFIPIIVCINGIMYHGIDHKCTHFMRKTWDILCNTLLVLYVNYWCIYRAVTHTLTLISVASFIANTQFRSNKLHVALVQFPLFIAMIAYITRAL